MINAVQYSVFFSGGLGLAVEAPWEADTENSDNGATDVLTIDDKTVPSGKDV